MFAHEAKARCSGETSIRLGLQLLKKSVQVKVLSTSFLYVRHICDTENIAIFTKGDAVAVNLPTVNKKQENYGYGWGDVNVTGCKKALRIVQKIFILRQLRFLMRIFGTVAWFVYTKLFPICFLRKQSKLKTSKAVSISSININL